MTTFAAIRKSDGAEVYRYNADAAVETSGFEFATHDHVAQPEVPVPGPETPTVQPVRISRLAFISRFTDAEAIALDLASQGATIPAASMRRYMQKVNAAEFIDLTRADTRAGVQALEQAGLLATGRAAVILDTPPSEQEVWRG